MYFATRIRLPGTRGYPVVIFAKGLSLASQADAFEITRRATTPPPPPADQRTSGLEH